MSNVAILIPVFNRESTIIRALESVMAQTYHDYRVIVVDDGSTDSSLRLVEDFARHYPPNKVFVYPLPGNVGVGGALNAGSEMIFDDTWLARLDSDDEYTPHYLETRMAIAAQFPDFELFYGGMVANDRDYMVPDCRNPGNMVHMSQTSQGPSLVVKVETFRRLGGFSPVRICEDFEFMWRARKSFTNIYKLFTQDYIYHRDTVDSLLAMNNEDSFLPAAALLQPLRLRRPL